MEVIKTAIPDVLIFKPKTFGDERGYFMETFREQWLLDQGVDIKFVQDNQSSSGKHVLRGLHYQLHQPQGKLVRVISGEVFDVAVDLRRSSPTFGKCIAAILSAENKHIFWIPPGFAHGFVVLSDSAEFCYKCTAYYAPEYDRSLLWSDPALNIPWPQIDRDKLILSDKDRAGSLLKDAEVYA
jgi:dTDP-4-dehydrorhamnose 3,5-epimerase